MISQSSPTNESGRYQIIEKAGSGHFSEVFKAIDQQSGSIVAVKDLNYSEEIQKLLVKELQILSCLDHPNIIKMLDVVQSPQRIRVVSDYMEENLLELYTTSKQGINENQLRCILYQCALGLEYLHRKRIIHRDIKPENIMINRKTALVKLIDFGLAKE
jgi:serine/threonine protein kinase